MKSRKRKAPKEAFLRRDLVPVDAPDGLLVTKTNELAVFAFPLLAPELPPVLSQAERDVVGLALIGLSNAQIARRRACSSRTVANQLASAFRKLSVGSRAELAARSFCSKKLTAK
jgi:DNA-binding CsgD family transcriptional regulator